MKFVYIKRASLGCLLFAYQYTGIYFTWYYALCFTAWCAVKAAELSNLYNFGKFYYQKLTKELCQECSIVKVHIVTF